MGTRHVSAQEFASELRKLGWDEENGPNHKKFTPPGGLKAGERPLVISHGSNNKEISLEADMVRNIKAFGHRGQAVLDAFNRAPRVTARKRPVRSSGAPTNGKTDQLALPEQQPLPTDRAVTPAPPVIDQRFGVPIGGGLRAQVLRVTPMMADRWLSMYQGPNRKLKEARVNRYAAEIEAGKWQLNGESIVFDSDGRLADGQHRLLAIKQAGKPVDAIVLYGVKPLQAQRTMDTGASRSLRDMLGMAGAKYEGHLSSAISHAWKLRKLGTWDSGDRNPAPQALIEYLCDNWILYTTEQFSYDGTTDRAKQLFSHDCDIPRWADQLNRKLPMGPSIYMACYWLFFAHTDAAPDEITTFFQSMVDQAEVRDGMRFALEPTDPRAHMVKILMNRRDQAGWASWPTSRRFAYLIKAWNLWRDGITRSQLVWKPNIETFPRPK